jgi:hypothetical protein
MPPLWDSEFRQCKWFKRGWTLQELLAPGVVEFFSREWHRLCDRISLKSLGLLHLDEQYLWTPHYPPSIRVPRPMYFYTFKLSFQRNLRLGFDKRIA